MMRSTTILSLGLWLTLGASALGVGTAQPAQTSATKTAPPAAKSNAKSARRRHRHHTRRGAAKKNATVPKAKSLTQESY
jgi:hypothetical protein